MNEYFGKMLKKLRKERNLSLEELARQSGISASYINRLENNDRRSPSFNKVILLANALRVEPWRLMGKSFKEWDNNGAIGLNELFFNHKIEHKGLQLSTVEKEILLEIIETVLEAEWTKESLLYELQKVAKLISDFKDL